MGILQSIQVLGRIKWEKGEFSLSELKQPPSLALKHWCSLFLGLLTQTWSCTSATHCQAFQKELNHIITISPGSPACKWQILGFLSLYNYMKFFIINLLIYMYIYVNLLLILSLQNPNTVEILLFLMFR